MSAFVQQKDEIASLQTAMKGAHLPTVEATLSAEMMQFKKTVIEPSFSQLESNLSRILEQLTSLNHYLSKPKEDSGLGDSLLLPASHDSTNCTVSSSGPLYPDLHCTTGITHCQKTQIKRKQKHSSAVTRSVNSTSTSVEERADVVLSQQLNGSGPPTPCDVDLTQQSPSLCTELICQSIQQQQQSLSQRLAAKRRKRAKPSPCSSPPCGPVAKKKQSPSWVSKQRSPVGGDMSCKGAVLVASQRSKRRSQRNRKPILKYGVENRPPGESEVSQSEPNSPKTDSVQVLQCSGSGDVLNDWLDFHTPPLHTSTSTSTSRDNSVSMLTYHTGAYITTISTSVSSNKFVSDK